MIDKKSLLNLEGHFSWNFGNKFFIETEMGNFVWSDPDYFGGDNSIKFFDGNLDDFCKQEHIGYTRDKGIHTIKKYCGSKIKLQK